MSSILKALRKLEHEKSGRTVDSIDIDSDILKISDSPRRVSVVGILFLLALFFGGGASVAYFYMKGTHTPQPIMNPQPESTAKSIPPPVRVPTVKPVAKSANKPVIIANKELPVKVLHKQQESLVFRNSINQKENKSAVGAVSGITEKPKTDAETAKIEPSENAPGPQFRVNGIAYQKNSADSVAIVNGQSVSNGSAIDDATVVEIRQDRVLFQREGKRFEVQLGQVNQ